MLHSSRSALALILLLFAIPAVAAPPPKEDPALAQLASRHRQFLEEVGPLLSDKERAAFLGLKQEYQRDAFIQRFWQVRDPFPKSAINEFRENWTDRLRLAKERYNGDLTEDRAQMLLWNGPPAEVLRATCTDVFLPLEVWYYPRTERINNEFNLIFLQPQGTMRGRYRLWYPSEGLQSLLALEMRVRGNVPLEQTILEHCPRGDEILDRLSSVLDWGQIEDRIRPDPGEEWLSTFLARSTEVPEGAGTFPAQVEVSFPGRYGSRTTVQAFVTVPREEARVEQIKNVSYYNFLVDGEILYKGELFENFRYRFTLPETQIETETAAQGKTGLPADAIPMVLQRYLRPGSYTLVLRIEDTAGKRYYREQRELEVPTVEGLTAAAAAPAPSSPSAAGALAEANASTLLSGDQTIRILQPQAGLITGKVRLEALTTGEGIARVQFELNGKPVLTKGRPPYSVELNLGNQPRIHTLTASALGANGERVAEDQILINAGPHRFSVRLVEPEPGKTYQSSLRAQVQVDVPEGEKLDRVELFLNDNRIATLFQAPFVQPVLIPQNQPLTYVRAVAYLADGNSSEDLVVVNAPDVSERVDIDLVEVYTSVVDSRQRPVEGLAEADFKVYEDGAEQEIRRFELMRDVPVYAGVLLDTSASMGENGGGKLEAAVRGALDFFQGVITPKDRAAIITFNDQPNLIVRFTNEQEVLAGGLTGLTAEGNTALHDSLIYALYYFGGLKGKRAIILLSDGQDAGSRYTFADALEYARRSGVSIYSIGIDLKEFDTRTKLQRLAEETGGRAYWVGVVGELGDVFEAIEKELRSQYLLTYQSPKTTRDDKFRSVEVKVAKPGLEAKTMRGYYP